MKSDIPQGHAAFTEYMDFCYHKVEINLMPYNIDPTKLPPLTDAYHAFLTAEHTATNPDTATPTAIHERNRLQKILEGAWRTFRNENLRYNAQVSNEDKESFGIKISDGTRHAAGVPTEAGTATPIRRGTCEFEIQVREEKTGKLKNPEHASGSNLYLAIGAIGEAPAFSDYHRVSYESDNTHDLFLRHEDIGKQANVFARYSNSHGKEGPEGPVNTFVIN
jgi:hypothetical protein